MTDIRPATSGLAAQIRKRYEGSRVPLVSTARVRQDVLALLEERKVLRRAAERLLGSAMPYAGDPSIAAALEEMRAVLEDRAGR